MKYSQLTKVSENGADILNRLFDHFLHKFQTNGWRHRVPHMRKYLEIASHCHHPALSLLGSYVNKIKEVSENFVPKFCARARSHFRGSKHHSCRAGKVRGSGNLRRFQGIFSYGEHDGGIRLFEF